MDRKLNNKLMVFLGEKIFLKNISVLAFNGNKMVIFVTEGTWTWMSHWKILQGQFKLAIFFMDRKLNNKLMDFLGEKKYEWQVFVYSIESSGCIEAYLEYYFSIVIFSSRLRARVQ